MSPIVNLQLEASQMERLSRLTSALGRTSTETIALLVEEGLRRAEFPSIDFRDSAIGRQAFVRGSSLAVWEVVWVARGYQMDAGQTAAHLGWPEHRVQAALAYAAAFPEEISQTLKKQDAQSFETLSALLPQTERFAVDESADPLEASVAGDRSA
jgi:hypothetical protein